MTRKILRTEDHVGVAGIINLPAPVNDDDAARLIDVTDRHDAYHFVQASAATTWVINHGLAFRPNVTCVDSLDREIVPATIDHAPNVATLTFSASVAGEAFLS